MAVAAPLSKLHSISMHLETPTNSKTNRTPQSTRFHFTTIPIYKCRFMGGGCERPPPPSTGNSIILRGFTASQINCHYKNRVHSLNLVSVHTPSPLCSSSVGIFLVPLSLPTMCKTIPISVIIVYVTSGRVFSAPCRPQQQQQQLRIRISATILVLFLLLLRLRCCTPLVYMGWSGSVYSE